MLSSIIRGAMDPSPLIVFGVVPLHLLSLVLQHIDSESRIRCAQVSSPWREILVNDALFWRDLDIPQNKDATRVVEIFARRSVSANTGQCVLRTLSWTPIDTALLPPIRNRLQGLLERQHFSQLKVLTIIAESNRYDRSTRSTPEEQALVAEFAQALPDLARHIIAQASGLQVLILRTDWVRDLHKKLRLHQLPTTLRVCSFEGISWHDYENDGRRIFANSVVPISSIPRTNTDVHVVTGPAGLTVLVMERAELSDVALNKPGQDSLLHTWRLPTVLSALNLQACDFHVMHSLVEANRNTLRVVKLSRIEFPADPNIPQLEAHHALPLLSNLDIMAVANLAESFRLAQMLSSAALRRLRLASRWGWTVLGSQRYARQLLRELCIMTPNTEELDLADGVFMAHDFLSAIGADAGKMSASQHWMQIAVLELSRTSFCEGPNLQNKCQITDDFLRRLGTSAILPNLRSLHLDKHTMDTGLLRRSILPRARERTVRGLRVAKLRSISLREVKGLTMEDVTAIEDAGIACIHSVERTS